MGRKLSTTDMELYRRVDEVLHYLWDPIGVAGAPGARDEYYSYLPHVFSLVKNTTDGKDVADYLTLIEEDSMGMTITDRSRKRAFEIAAILINYKESIKGKAEQTNLSDSDSSHV